MKPAMTLSYFNGLKYVAKQVNAAEIARGGNVGNRL